MKATVVLRVDYHICFCYMWPTLEFCRRGIRLLGVLLTANDLPRVSLEGSGPGGIRSVWDGGAKRKQGANMCVWAGVC